MDAVVDLIMKMTGVATKFGREVKVSNLSRGVSNPRRSAAGVSKSTSIQVDMMGAQSCSVDVVGGFRWAAAFEAPAG